MRPGGRTPQSAEPGRSDGENLACVDGQQGHGAAEEDGKKVEGDGAENRRATPNEGNAGKHRLQAGRLRFGDLPFYRQAEENKGRSEKKSADDRIDEGDVRGVEESAEGGSDDRGRLRERRRPGYRLREETLPGKGGQQRLRCGHLERTGTPRTKQWQE